MTSSDTFESDWQDLKDAVASGRIPSPKSVMWEYFVRDFSAAAAGGQASPASGQRGYNFLMNSDEKSLRLEKAWLRTTFLASAALARASTALWNFNLDRSSGPLMAFPKFLRTLSALGLTESYARFCGETGISPCSFNTAKLFYVSGILLDALPASTGLSMLEIGGGTGNLAVIINRRQPARRYVIVDLPEMLLHSARTIRRLLPDVPVAFAHRQKGPRLELPGSGFFLVPHHIASRLPDGAFDACLNVDSFQEMSAEQVHGYLDLIGRCAKPGAILLTLNRRKQVGSFDNNPLLYPYPDSKILRWETDPFMHSSLRVDRKDHHLLRVERVRQDPRQE